MIETADACHFRSSADLVSSGSRKVFSGGIHQLTYYTKLYPAAIYAQMAREVCLHRRSHLDSI